MTIRERVIAAIPEMERMASEGMKAREIADALDINYNTLQMYRRQLGLPHLGKGRIIGPNHGAWRGGRVIDKRSGYVRVYQDVEGRPRYQYEHTLIGEQIIGRPLNSNEVVHHINGNPADNRPENLRVVTRSEHARLHRQLELVGWEMLHRGHVAFSDASGYRLTL